MTTIRLDTNAQDLLRITDDGTFQHGSAEPWIANILTTLLVGNATRSAIEIGSFQGYTSKRLVQALAKLSWNTQLQICEIDSERALQTCRTIETLPLIAQYKVRFRVDVANSLDWIPTLPDESVDFVWLDGCHEQPHVLRELHALLSKLAPGGLVCGHDVFGLCDLKEIFALVASQVGWRSMSLDLPRIGAAGGIGLLQKPR